MGWRSPPAVSRVSRPSSRSREGEDRVVLLLTLLGKEQAMEVPIHQVNPS